MDKFLKKSIKLLQDIQADENKSAWCREYSVYFPNTEQQELKRSIDNFISTAYNLDLILPDYRELVEKSKLIQYLTQNEDLSWTNQLSYTDLLASISWHFRRDRFDEGSLIRSSIASGAMLKLLQRLELLKSTRL